MASLWAGGITRQAPGVPCTRCSPVVPGDASITPVPAPADERRAVTHHSAVSTARAGLLQGWRRAAAGPLGAAACRQTARTQALCSIDPPPGAGAQPRGCDQGLCRRRQGVHAAAAPAPADAGRTVQAGATAVARQPLPGRHWHQQFQLMPLQFISDCPYPNTARPLYTPSKAASTHHHGRQVEGTSHCRRLLA